MVDNCTYGTIAFPCIKSSLARGSSIGFSQVSPTKVEAHKSFIFTESSLTLKLRKTGLILLSHFNIRSLLLHHFSSIFYAAAKCHSQLLHSTLSWLVKSATKMVTGCQRKTEVAIFYKTKRWFMLNIKNMGLCLYKWWRKNKKVCLFLGVFSKNSSYQSRADKQSSCLRLAILNFH